MEKLEIKANVNLIKWDDFHNWLYDNQEEIINSAKKKFPYLDWYAYEDEEDEDDELTIDDFVGYIGDILSEHDIFKDAYTFAPEDLSILHSDDALRVGVRHLFFTAHPELSNSTVLVLENY